MRYVASTLLIPRNNQDDHNNETALLLGHKPLFINDVSR